MDQETKAPQVTNVVSPAPFGKMEARTGPTSPEPPTSDQISKAWMYYQHADSLQHQRHNIFILAQTILTAAYVGFAQAPTPTKVLLATIGAAYALMWFMLTERVSKGMDALSDKYLEEDEDKIYKHYLDSLGWMPSGRTILNRIMPISTFIAATGIMK
jgi:hypothetical protein